jgi:putative DNA methylase
VAYLWTRTVRCKNPACGATVPLVKQTWLCKKPGRYVALKMVAEGNGREEAQKTQKGEDHSAPSAPSRGNSKGVRFEVVEAGTAAGLGFDPEAFCKAGNATCPFCGTITDSDYVKAEGCAGRMGQQMMAIVCTKLSKEGKVYLPADDVPDSTPSAAALLTRIEHICARTGLTVPNEPLPRVAGEALDSNLNTAGSCRVRPYGFRTFGDLFTQRQKLSSLSFAVAVRELRQRCEDLGISRERSRTIATLVACAADKLVDFNSALCVLKPDGGRGIVHTFGRQAIAMVWDYAEANPFNAEIACWESSIKEVVANLGSLTEERPAIVSRGSATQLPWGEATFDAVITDPPYYDNVPYGDISDFFYVWLKRMVGQQYAEHFATETTPKRQEAVADSARFGGDALRARGFYEDMMFRSFVEAHRVLKTGGNLTVVYAHKTTLGWSTLVDALRRGGFTVSEAWPLDTETSGRLRAHDSSALASSIFLVARKRNGAKAGSYEDEVRPDLEQIVRERVETLWRMGITGADLIIAAVGAGLRAFTRFASVEYTNGEEVPAEKFLGEVESVVLETLLEKILSDSRSSRRLPAESSAQAGEEAHSAIGSVDGPSRFYVLWRYAYRTAELDAGEAIVFTYGQPVELEGADGLATGALALVEKKKGKYRLRDYTERGPLERLGLPDAEGKPAPLVDVLHRTLWLMENQPRKLPAFLDEARPDRERLRLVAQALAGAALSGGSEEQTLVNTTAGEQSALGKLLANWRALIPETLFTK